MESILVPLGLFGMVLGIVVTVTYFNSRNRRAMLDTVQEAVRAGQTLDTELVKSLGVKQGRTGGDIRSGLILIAVALGLVALGRAVEMAVPVFQRNADTPEMMILMSGVAAIPGLIGVVLVIFGLGAAIAQRRKDP